MAPSYGQRLPPHTEALQTKLDKWITIKKWVIPHNSALILRFDSRSNNDSTIAPSYGQRLPPHTEAIQTKLDKWITITKMGHTP